MAKKVKRRLADDIRASLYEALAHAAGKRTKAIVHRITPRDTHAKLEPRAVRRAPDFLPLGDMV